VLIEIRQDLVTHVDGVEHWAVFLASVFNAIYRDPTLYSVEVYEDA